MLGRKQDGFTLIEVVAAVGLIAVLAAIVTTSFVHLEGRLSASSEQIAMTIKLARAKAVGTTSYMMVAPESGTVVAVYRAKSCDPVSAERIDSLTLHLPKQIHIADTDWRVCFSPLGLADSSPAFDLVHENSRRSRIAVFVGGAVRIDG